MAIYLGPGDLQQMFAQGLVTPRDCVEAVAGSFREHGRAKVHVLPRQILWADASRREPRARALKLGAAYMQESRVMGASIYATHFTPGSVEMWINVFSGVTGQMLGVINSKHVSVWKTAATAALATRELARRDARRMALIGAGSYAMEQLTFMAALYRLACVRCFSRNAQALRDFCARASRELGLEVQPAESAQAAVADADIVTTITTSPVPVVLGAWLPDGVHCNIMGQHAPTTREVDTEAVVGSRLVVDALEQALGEKGEILIPIAEGAITASDIHAELGAVLAGHAAGRTESSQRTMFCSGGTAFEYMGLCSMLIEKAMEAGVGLPLAG